MINGAKHMSNAKNCFILFVNLVIMMLHYFNKFVVFVRDIIQLRLQLSDLLLVVDTHEGTIKSKR